MKLKFQRQLGMKPKRKHVHTRHETEILRERQRDRLPFCYWCGIAYGDGYMQKVTHLDTRDELVAAHRLCASIATEHQLQPYHLHQKRGELV